jgi:tetratricopeptide (TPR) repeat protein
MPKPAQTVPSAANANRSAPLWPALLLVALTSAAAGALGMWAWMQTHTPARGAETVAPAGGAAATAPDTHEPSPDLTAGQSAPQAARTRGDFYYDHSNWPKAVVEYEAAIQQGNDGADIRTDLANALQFSGHGPEAVAHYEAAQRLNPQHEPSLFNLGVCYTEALGDAARAVATWQQFLQRFPNSAKLADAQRMLAMAQAMATGAMPPGHPPLAGAAAAPGATGLPPAPADADLQKLMQFVKPATAAEAPPQK